MTAFAINVDTAYDSLSTGSVNATLDTYTVSVGSTLTVDTDSYQCAGHSAAKGSLDTIQFSGAGGRVFIDGSKVRVIPYNTGTGNVPAIGTTISQGGVSAVLLGVWASWLVEPTAAAAAMPASGFIKVKTKTGGNFASGALTGIGASATGPDVVGWIEIRGPDTGTITLGRTGKFEAKGDYFELGTTNGSAGQTLGCPTAGTNAGVIPGVQIETSAGSGVYEWYASVGTLAASASIPTDATRGKLVWQTTNGIRIGNDGTNNVGYLPPTGCKVRIPNILFTTCTRTVSGSGPRVLPNATLATRHEFITTGGGLVDLDKVVMQWYANWAQPYSIILQNSAISDTVVISEQPTSLYLKQLCVAPTQVQVNQPLTLTSCFQGGTFDDCYFVRATLANNQVVVAITSVNDITINRNKALTLTNRANGTGVTWGLTNCQRLKTSACVAVGARFLWTGCTKPVQGDTVYADLFTGTTTSAAGQAAGEFSGCSGIDAYGITTPVTNTHPYDGLFKVTQCDTGLFYNIGSYASPYDCGSANACNCAVTSGGSNLNISIKRVWLQNTRTGVQNLRNNDYGCIVQNCGGDYADTQDIPFSEGTYASVANTSPTAGSVAVYGTHWATEFISTTAGGLITLMNEPTADTAAQCAVTAGAVRFNSSGTAALVAVGDQLTLEMAYFAKGFTAFTNSAPTIVGFATTNLTFEYQVDLGAGYGGTWKTLNASNLSGEGAIDPATGFRLKLRITCATASTANTLTRIFVALTTTSSAQSTNLYDLRPVAIQVTSVVAGTRLLIKRTDTSAVIYNGIVTGTSFSQTFDLIGVPISIELRKASAAPYYQPWLTTGTVTENGFIAVALQIRDDQ